jgi:hypothetical protein
VFSLQVSFFLIMHFSIERQKAQRATTDALRRKLFSTPRESQSPAIQYCVFGTDFLCWRIAAAFVG